jgi:hypothetical protein
MNKNFMFALAAVLFVSAPLSAFAASPVYMSEPVLYYNDLAGTDYTMVCSGVDGDTIAEIFKVSDGSWSGSLLGCYEADNMAGNFEGLGSDSEYEIVVANETLAQDEDPDNFTSSLEYLTSNPQANWFVGTSTFWTSSQNHP